MRPNRIPRRSSTPAWIQDVSTEALHAMAGHLRRVSTEQDLSGAQEWFWDRCLSELEVRNALLPPDLRCQCDLCLAPFAGEQLSFDDWQQVVMSRRRRTD